MVRMKSTAQPQKPIIHPALQGQVAPKENKPLSESNSKYSSSSDEKISESKNNNTEVLKSNLPRDTQITETKEVKPVNEEKMINEEIADKIKPQKSKVSKKRLSTFLKKKIKPENKEVVDDSDSDCSESSKKDLVIKDNSEEISDDSKTVYSYNEYFVVEGLLEEIVDEKGKIFYFVKWKDFDFDECTKEPKEGFHQEVIDDFESGKNKKLIQKFLKWKGKNMKTYGNRLEQPDSKHREEDFDTPDNLE